MRAESEVERRVWRLLTRDFTWEIPASFEVKLYGGAGASDGPVKLQVFEVAVAAIFAQIRPEYDWYVTPNRPDGGLDFVGRHGFLEHEALGITAAITVGGQCKKRTRVDDIVQEVAGSLVRMASTINPTFFVVALSARLDQDRVKSAQLILERAHQRQCHILDRHQIEGLIYDHLPVVHGILREALTTGEVCDVVDYFDAHKPSRPSCSIEVAAPEKVLAGVPFSVTLSVLYSAASASATRLWWKPADHGEGRSDSITLISPFGADMQAGVELVPSGAVDDPIRVTQTIELVTYSVGKVDLGEVCTGLQAPGLIGEPTWIGLGRTQVIENVRPRFFDRPFRAGLDQLASAYDRTLTGMVGSIGVVGAGGSGKSRLCDEFTLERRRLGANVVSAQQAKTLDEPHRIISNLFDGLIPHVVSFADPADRVIKAIQRYDASLAERAGPAIHSIFGTSFGTSGGVSEQSLLSSLLLLIVARAHQAPLIVHLQDLHWCAADVLSLLERLVWQLEGVLSSNAPISAGTGVLFVFEGRIRERHGLGTDSWVSEPFETFLQKLDCPIVRCSSFASDDGLDFIRRLFEDRYSARRIVNDDLLELQRQLIDQIDRSAGGNPFHSLEQVQLLKERRVLGQNPDTGLLYLIQPAPNGSLLPDSVFEAIQLRWRYLAVRAPPLALLVWAASLLEDRIPGPLFHLLWRKIAPDVSLGEVDATDMLWTGDIGGRGVMFRHENYFRSIRRFEVSSHDRRQVVEIYAEWFDAAVRRDHLDQFRWARVLLELPEPDVGGARRLLAAALRGARRDGDVRLVRRILATSLDLRWDEDARSPIPTNIFLVNCDRELALIRDLMGSDRFQSEKRLDGLRIGLCRRLTSERSRSLQTLVELKRRQLVTEVLRSQILYNDRRPTIASEVAALAVSGIRELRPDDASGDDATWDALEMEALYSQAAALAVSGEIEEALRVARYAVDVAQRYSSPLSYKVVSSYANILLARDPATSESILRSCLAEVVRSAEFEDVRYSVEVNLAMALVLRSYRLRTQEDDARMMVAEARELLTRVFTNSYHAGRYSNAGAAALMLGIVSAGEDDGSQISWFAQAVAAAARGHKTETLWRAHINLATALHRREVRVSESVRDHAKAAVEIMEETLSPFPYPDRSARFDLIRIPLAQAVRFLLLAGDPAGRAALVRYPGLRASFQDVQAGILREDRGGYQSHEWLRIGSDDYVIY